MTSSINFLLFFSATLIALYAFVEVHNLFVFIKFFALTKFPSLSATVIDLRISSEGLSVLTIVTISSRFGIVLFTISWADLFIASCNSFLAVLTPIWLSLANSNISFALFTAGVFVTTSRTSPTASEVTFDTTSQEV